MTLIDLVATSHLFGLAGLARPVVDRSQRAIDLPASASSAGQFTHLRPAAVPPPIEPNLHELLGLPNADEFARKMIAAGARVRGEKALPAVDWIAGPTQTTRRVTGADLLRVARRQGLAE